MLSLVLCLLCNCCACSACSACSAGWQIAERFQKDPTVSCLLLTARAGGLGLNLSAAAAAFFLEHDWNPQVRARRRGGEGGVRSCLRPSFLV